MNVTERINRILFILSYVSQNQGVRVEELARRVGLRPRQLVKEMEFMLLIGKPPFRPDDYVDIYVEDQRVYVEFDQMLNRPLRFTQPEAMALLLSLQLLDPEVDPRVVGSLKAKIERAIASSMDASTRLEDHVALDRPSRPVSQYFLLLRQAVEDRVKIEIDYYSLTRNKTTRRVVHPYFLMKYLGYWYLTGYCELRKDQRTFKFERILAVEILSESFPPAEDLDVDKYKREFLTSMGRYRVEIFFDAEVAPWVAERWGSSASRDERGNVVLTLSTDSLEYPSRLVLGFAPHARPLSPPEFIEKIRSDAREMLKLYERKGAD